MADGRLQMGKMERRKNGRMPLGIFLFIFLTAAPLAAQPSMYRTSVEADGRHAAGEEWFAGVTAQHSLRDIPFSGRYVLEAVRATVPRTEFVAGLRFGEDKLHRVTGDALASYYAHAAFLVKDDLAVGPMLRYDHRDAGSLEFETVIVAAMADVYGSKIRMRWVLGAAMSRRSFFYPASGRFPEYSGTEDPDWGFLVENHLAHGGEISGYTHVISLQILGGGLLFRYAPALEFALSEWLTTGPLFEGSFGAYSGLALRADVGLAVRVYLQSRFFLEITPRYPLWSYDDHQIDGLFLTGGIGVRF
jgi:hypothetical protein